MADATLTTEVKFKHFSKGTTIIVRFIETREWKIRKWLAKQLITAAARVMGCGVEIEDPPLTTAPTTSLAYKASKQAEKQGRGRGRGDILHDNG